jgi:hypothetical protein
MASWLFQSRGGGLRKIRWRCCLSVSLIMSFFFWSDAVPSGRSSKRPGTNCVLSYVSTVAGSRCMGTYNSGSVVKSLGLE